MNMGAPSRLLLGLAALVMLVGGAFHGLVFPRAVAMINASNLSGHGAAIYKGLWLNDAAVVMLIGLIYLVLASRPALATKAVLILLAALPLAGALSIYSTVGNFLPGHLLLASAIMAGAAALVPATEKNRRGGLQIASRDRPARP
jgi:hypothetical protein